MLAGIIFSGVFSEFSSLSLDRLVLTLACAEGDGLRGMLSLMTAPRSLSSEQSSTWACLGFLVVAIAGSAGGRWPWARTVWRLSPNA
jgi:hypothetical protein